MSQHEADRPASADAVNGAAMAAFVAAGIGAFAMGLIVLLSESGLLSAPAIYGPSGGVSGRTTLAVLAWLGAWLLLHRRWRERHVAPRTAWRITAILTAAGVVATFPPVWKLL